MSLEGSQLGGERVRAGITHELQGEQETCRCSWRRLNTCGTFRELHKSWRTNQENGGGVDGGCLWRAITEQDFSGENCQDLVTNGCWGEGRGWLASGLREALSYCTTFREAPAPRQPSQNLKDIKIVTYLNVLNASWIHKIETSFLKYSLQVLSWTQNLWLDMKSIRYFSQLSVLYTFSVKSVHLQRQCYIYSFDNHWCGNCYVEYCRCYFAKGLKDKFWKYLENKSASDNGPTFLW